MAGGCAVDIATPTGNTCFMRPIPGFIALASYYGTYGNTIKTQSRGTVYSTLYAHLSQFQCNRRAASIARDK